MTDGRNLANRGKWIVRSVLIVLGLVVVFDVSVQVVRGRFAHYDESIYKAAGRELAQSGHFAAPEIVNYLDYDVHPDTDEVFFHYVPGYPFLFGLTCKVFGFGPRVNIVYDLVIHLTLVVLGGFLAHRLVPQAPVELPILVSLALYPLGTLGRPDELAMVLGLLGLLPLLGSNLRARHAVLSGLGLGLCMSTSTGAGIVFGFLALPLVALRVELSWRTRLARLLVMGILSLVVLASVLVPILSRHPGAYRQFLWIASMTAAGQQGFARNLYFSFSVSFENVIPTLAGLLVSLMLLAVAVRNRQVRSWMIRWLGAWLAYAWLLAQFPGKGTYVWFLGPWALAAGAAGCWEIASRYRGLAVSVALPLLAGVLIGSIPHAIQTIQVATLPQNQRLDFVQARLRELIPDGASVFLTTKHWWFLADRCRVVDLTWSRLEDPLAMEYVVLSGNGSGKIGEPVWVHESLRPVWAQHYEVIYDGLSRTPTNLLFRKSNSAYGFGPLVLKRIDNDKDTQNRHR